MNHKDAISIRPLPSHLSSSTYPLPSHRPSHSVTPPAPSILGYTETPFGHQDAILSTSSFGSETALAWVGDMKPLGSGKSRKRGGLRDADADADADAGKEKERAGTPPPSHFTDHSPLTHAYHVAQYPSAQPQRKIPSPLNPSHTAFIPLNPQPKPPYPTPISSLLVHGMVKSDYRNSIRAQITGNIPIPGVIDSVQLIPPPKLFLTSIPHPLPHQTPPLPPPPHYPRFRYSNNTRIWVLMASTHSTPFPHLILIDARSFVFSDYVYNSWKLDKSINSVDG
ncbi:hypothetical protein D9756_011210 [Leucocoprinus leucothites]|uniref:Uncharacterized protein n=1 Tax=Leucocoprinus leucothites TaxID=201217 RepID=A0A8H5FR81_9AGAR|nr:hypothetical protein D9756_011210 [Leucoagaricus leucothites]